MKKTLFILALFLSFGCSSLRQYRIFVIPNDIHSDWKAVEISNDNYYYEYKNEDFEIVLSIYTTQKFLSVGPAYLPIIPLPSLFKRWAGYTSISFTTNYELDNISKNKAIKLNNLYGNYSLTSYPSPSIKKFSTLLSFKCDLDYIDTLEIIFGSVSVEQQYINIPNLKLIKKNKIIYNDKFAS
jgi:hypothetical protein